MAQIIRYFAASHPSNRSSYVTLVIGSKLVEQLVHVAFFFGFDSRQDFREFLHALLGRRPFTRFHFTHSERLLSQTSRAMLTQSFKGLLVQAEVMCSRYALRAFSGLRVR